MDGNLQFNFLDRDDDLCGLQEHFYLETQASIAVPKGEDGEMELFVSTQNPTLTQVKILQQNNWDYFIFSLCEISVKAEAVLLRWKWNPVC